MQTIVNQGLTSIKIQHLRITSQLCGIPYVTIQNHSVAFQQFIHLLFAFMNQNKCFGSNLIKTKPAGWCWFEQSELHIALLTEQVELFIIYFVVFFSYNTWQQYAIWITCLATRCFSKKYDCCYKKFLHFHKRKHGCKYEYNVH